MAKDINNNPAATQSNIRANASYSTANQMFYAIQQVLLNVNTSIPCEIISKEGAYSYTIQPLANILDGAGKPIAAPLITNVPYMQLVGGSAGVIVEPLVGDTVLAIFCQRDITVIKKNWQTANPDSLRKFALPDAIIVGRLSNTAPTVFVKITAAGVEIEASGLPVTVNADEILLGESAANNVLLQGVPMNVDIVGVQPGTGVAGVVMTVNSGGSSVVKGAV